MSPKERPMAPAGDETEQQFLRRHKLLVRKTRDVSHQALYFLGLVQPTTSREGQRAVEEYRPFGLEQVRALVRGVHVRKEAYAEAERFLDSGEAPPEVRDDFQQAIEEYRSWREIFDALDAPDAAGADTRKLRDQFISYLRRSDRGQSQFRSLSGFLRKNLALVWGVILLAAAAMMVEAVKVLLWNEGWYLVLPALLLFVPLVVSRVWTHRSLERKGGAVPFWDLSGPAFRSLRGQAREPGPLIERWPQDTGMPERTAVKLVLSLLIWLILVGAMSYLISRGWRLGQYTLGIFLLAGLVFYVVAGARWLRGASLPWQIASGHVVKLTSYVVWWLAVVGLYSLLVWRGVLGDSALTVFLILSIFYFVLLAAHLLDFWDYLDPRPVRFIFLLAGGTAIGFLVGGLGREFFLVLFASGGLLYLVLFLRRWRQGSASMALALVLLLLAMLLYVGRQTHRKDEWTNGGSPLPRLQEGEWPFPGSGPVVVLAASGGGSRAAYYTALTFQHLHRDEPEIASRLQAISSVSGGSLANAAYVARRVGKDPDLGRIEVGEGEEDRHLLHTSVGRDFLFPTLKGALVPGTSRGREIEKFWDEEDVALNGLTLSDLVEAWREARSHGADYPPFPVPLFNSTTLDAHAVVITPLAREFYTNRRMRDEAFEDDELADAGDATWVYYRDGIYALEDFLDGYDPPLSAAVRASANFPFGFPLVRLRTDEPAYFSPGWRSRPTDRVSLTDGGALSNSGMWTLTNLLLNRAQDLRERGVLLLVVDASKMPTYGGVGRSIQRLWGTIGDQAPIAQNLHRRMLDLLEKEYGNDIAVVQLDLIAKERYNVLTTWALDSNSQQLLKESFDDRWPAERQNLLAAWQALTSEPRLPALIARRRPPLD